MPSRNGGYVRIGRKDFVEEESAKKNIQATLEVLNQLTV
jgi:hypothetical protein